ncbi:MULTISPECIES: PASTA domain-containing protein [Weeksella]|uniref:PASTA domain containing protein n=1 Tax=Weeksella virosa (strain ATCC 43766 / DSM 16922 / JCM 21250 / CCUG 30538 / CDC 9751 / IAM 14551 / NBRC 16016 / NCTC 11634 / CL345/78) TaxID=865938 RepID=F0NZA0_WEEVC|nr:MULTISPECIES: PASTA domain-containing protein [Weeksella]ADX67229.1 PASTA domain containing protein [Weeksella virosa DSM 16922]MDK7375038.1 PASTA domain-containing protein [Weeksella virosa]MDK7675923.1 PASTA domain-containing protein [Weeksella virosa]OFM81674.1 serine/threonine kinase [Weeksella sp. HMSC059D05]SUP53498.1 PASTA domain [Weeksella virosa]
MKLINVILSWKFWLNLIIIFGLGYGLYHTVFNIWLSSYTNHGEAIEVPDLSKMNIKQATAALEDLGLTYEIDSIKYDPKMKPYTVIDYYPAKGFKVKEGRRIFIKSNPRTYAPVELPDLIGKSKRLAFTQLNLSDLIIENIIYEPDLAKNAVLRILYNGKEIKPGTILPRFAKIDLVLGRGLMHNVMMPNLIGLDLSTVRSILNENFFELGQVRFLGGGNDTIAARVVYQFPLSRDRYDQGLPVDIWLSDKTSTEISAEIKMLDRQFKNFIEDTITGSKVNEYIERSQGTTPAEPTPPVPQPKPQDQLPPKKPEGIEIE